MMVWPNFASFINRQISALGIMLFRMFSRLMVVLRKVYKFSKKAIGVYSIVVLIAAAVSLVMIISSVLIGSPIFTGLAFVISLSLVLICWLPIGGAIKVLSEATDYVEGNREGEKKNIFPNWIRAFVAWVAFVGFIGLVLPEILTLKSMIGAALIGFIVMGLSSKFNLLDNVVFPLVIIMVLVAAWQQFAPESYRSATRYAKSQSMRFTAGKDRASIKNETEALSTYATLLRDVKCLYLINENQIDQIAVDLQAGEVFRLVNHKENVLLLNGHAFVEIQLANDKNSFVDGNKYYIEAEFVEIVSARNYIADKLTSSEKKEELKKPVAVYDSIFSSGTHYIDVDSITPFNVVIYFNQGSGKYWLDSENFEFEIVPPGEEGLKATPGLNLGHSVRPTFRIKGNERVRLEIS